MKIVIDISEEIYAECKGDVYYPDTGGELFEAVRNGTPISEWLSSFNTESAPKCFEAVQKLKMEVEANANSD